jgi:hypothetical protein
MGCMFREFNDMEGNRPFQPLLKTLQKGIIKRLPRVGRMANALGFDWNERKQVLDCNWNIVTFRLQSAWVNKYEPWGKTEDT